MDKDLIFDGQSWRTAFDNPAPMQLAAAPAAEAPYADALPQPFDAAKVVIPEGTTVVHVPVEPGLVLELPFAGDAQLLAAIGDGNLAIKVGDLVIVLEGYVAAADDPQHPVVIAAADGTPLDIAAILAATDPGIEIETAAGPGGSGGAGGQGADNSGAIFQQLGDGEGGLGGFQGVGGQDDSTTPGGFGPAGAGNIVPPPQATETVNVAPQVGDIDVSMTEDDGTFVSIDLNKFVTITDPDSTVFSFVGVNPGWLGANGVATFPVGGHFDYLAGGEQYDFDQQFQVSDGQNLSNVATAHFHILGVNDKPGFSGDTSGTATEDSPAIVTGTLGVSDLDHDQSHTQAVTTKQASDNGYGWFTVDADGHWSYELDNGNATVNALGPTSTPLSDSFTLKTTDGTEQQIAITINGTNDSPVAKDFVAPDAIYEDSVTSLGGFLRINGTKDPDTPPSGVTFSAVSALPPGVTLDTNGDITVNAGAAAYQHLAAGQTGTYSFTWKAFDGTAYSNEATATFTVTGINDTPTLTGDKTGTITEDSPSNPITGTLRVNDADDNESHTQAVTTKQASDNGYGWFTVDADGHWSYELDNANAAVNALESTSAPLSDSFTLKTTDGTAQQIAVTINGVNDAPEIGGMGGRLHFTEGDAAKVIDASVTVGDVDSANFNGGRLTVAFAANGTADDRLAILNEGSAAGQIGINGANVTYGGAVIGTWSGGSSGQELVIDFTSDSATAAAAEALIEHITYGNGSNNPGSADRSVTFSLTDGDGTALGGKDTGTAAATIHVTPVNTAPIVTSIELTMNEEHITVVSDLRGFVKDPDSSSFTFVADGALPAGASLGSDGAYRLDLGGYDFLAAGEQVLVSLKYHVSDGVIDSNTATFGIWVTGINDAPLIGGAGGTLNVAENAAPAAVAPAATVSDIDSANFNHGRLTVSLTANGTREDQLSILADGDIGLSGANVTFGGAVIGTWSGGNNGRDLVIDFTSDSATAAAAQALIQHIAYATTAESALDRSIGFTLTDGDGRALGGKDTATASVGVHVTLTNDVPFIPTLLTTASEGDVVSFDLATASLVRDNDSSSFTWALLGLPPAGLSLSADGKLLVDLTGYDALAAGEQAQFMAAYQVSDGLSDSNIAPLVLTVLGVNDAPVLGDMGGTLDWSLRDGAKVIDGAVALSDIDSKDFNDGKLVVSMAGGIGSADHLGIENQGTGAGQIGVAGSNVTYEGAVIGAWGTAGGNLVVNFATSGVSPEAVQALIEHITYSSGVTLVGKPDRTVTFSLTDGDGTAGNGTDTGTATVTIHGINAPPIINGISIGVVKEDDPQFAVASGQLGINDPDPGEAKFIPLATNGQHGTFTINEAGIWEYHLNTADPAVNALNETDSLADGFYATSADYSLSVPVVITILGHNDAPVLAGTNLGTVADTAHGLSFKLSDSLVTDPDDTSFTWTAASTLPAGIALDTDGTLHVDSQYNYGYLQPGQTASLAFDLRVSDGQASSNTATFNLTVAGTNDAPLLGGQELLRGGLSEDAVGVTVQLTNFYIYDPDSANFTWKAGSTLLAGISIDADGLLHLDLAGHYDDLESGASRLIDIDLQVNDGTSDSNVSNFWIWINGESEAPVIGGMGGTLGYDPADGAKVIDDSVTVFDLDTTDFDGGSLTVALVANGGPGDILGIANEGTGAGQIGVSGSTVTYGGAAIGTFSGGANGSDLLVNFAGTVTTDAAKALIEHITYSSGANVLGTPDKTVTFTLSDGNGSGSATTTIDPNVAPLLGGQELLRGGLSEDAVGVTVQLTNFYIYDPDSVNFTWKAGSTLPAGISIDADGLLHLDLAGHYDDLESGASRLIDIDLQVNDGTSDSNVSNFWIWINGESELPVIGGMGGTLDYAAGDGAKVVDNAVTVFDLDTTDFHGGNLTVALAANGAPGDILGIANEGTGAGQIGVSGSTVTYGGAAIGTFSGGANGSDLVIDFAGTVTTDAAKALIEHITYSSGGASLVGAPDKIVTFSLSDANGFGSAAATIHGVNTVPTIGGTAAGAVEEDNPQRAEASGLLTINDPDPGEAKFIPAILNGQYGTFILQDTGAWQYFLRQDDPAVNSLKDGDSVIDGFNVVSSDHSAIPSVSIIVQGHNDAPVAADDLVVASNGRAGFELPTWALLANDSDPDSTNLSVTHVDVVGSSLHGVTGPIGGDLVVFTSGGIGQFTYQANDGSVADAAATVTVVDQIPGQVLGTAAHEILVSGQRGERIDGQGGSDLIFGGGGDDTLIFHAGDTAQGGADSVALGGGLGAVGGRGDVLAIDFDVDFTALDLSRFQGIETLSLVNTESGGSGVQSLTIGAANVLSLSDHTITPGGVFAEHAAIRVDADSVDQLYLSISKDGGSWSDTGVNLGDYQVYAHDAGAGADAYVMVASANTGSVHLNQDA